MRDADAEPERAHGPHVGDVPAQRVEHATRDGVVRREHVRESLDVVAATAVPGHLPKIGSVGEPEVGERDEPLLLDRVPEPELGGDPAVEPLQHREAVGAFRRRGETKQLDRRHVVEEPCPRLGGGVVELVDDDDLEARRRDPVQRFRPQGLYRGEHVLEAGRFDATDPQLAEARIAERVPERRERLRQDLLAMGDEQEGRPAPSVDLRGVVERRHDRLARAGGGDEQVPVMTLRTGQRDLLEQARLERQRVQLGRRQHDPVAASLALQAGGELGGVVVDEILVLPVRLEDGPHLVDDVGVARGRDAHVPLETVDLRHLREVRGPDVRGREPGVAVEQPRLGVKSCAAGVVGDAHRGTCLRQRVECRPFGGAGVDRRQQPHGPARRHVPAQGVEQGADAAEPHEGHDDVDPVRRVDLRADLLADVGLAGRVRQEGGVQQGGERKGDRLGLTVRQRPPYRLQHPSPVQRCVQRRVPGTRVRIHRLLDLLDDPLRQLDSARDALPLGQAVDRAHQAARQVERQAIARFLPAQRPLGRGQGGVQSLEPGGERAGDQGVVQTSVEIGHRSECRVEVVSPG